MDLPDLFAELPLPGPRDLDPVTVVVASAVGCLAAVVLYEDLVAAVVAAFVIAVVVAALLRRRNLFAGGIVAVMVTGLLAVPLLVLDFFGSLWGM